MIVCGKPYPYSPLPRLVPDQRVPDVGGGWDVGASTCPYLAKVLAGTASEEEVAELKRRIARLETLPDSQQRLRLVDRFAELGESHFACAHFGQATLDRAQAES
ncbi:hypothetical protein A3C18_02140 [Candidatus Kaiserbacteria bacterium RIFCSPHIGHO2_02_FULL_54_11b]|uniref:Uncharacterized protein n=2 Tax=Candidatus Kaiseribacteriota TaxID=1752734 RepID=A0A1F6CJ02_9BACT|nr:MAG: hypothetical protein A2704_04940 [Candidatus Kaiserbacteria bacterium RIFCSPHIGHO2_01_FULL_54_36b]OGG63828.1 MAG: hypothetical protein A3C18_02140 [Candidatus Kaiserbacteria bacterium RIFCSPHIGHO2_02_FULL_54_11b]